MSSLKRRLEKLEGQDTPLGPEPNLLARHLVEALRSNRLTNTRYPATDREINLLAAMSAYRDSGKEPAELEGVYELPSGAEIHWVRNDGLGVHHDIYVTPRAELEDLSEDIRLYVERMAAEKQAYREERLAVLLDRDPPPGDPGEDGR